jgi:molybdenum cofactor guanylyltransferase
MNRKNLKSAFMQQKHTKLAKPQQGLFARNEWSFLGTNCTVIQELAKDINTCLSSSYKIGYLDASHKEIEGELPIFAAEWTDKIAFQRQEQNVTFNAQNRSAFFNDMDLVLVNGNHFEAEKQVVVLDPKKMESLSKKLKKLTQVEAFLTQSDSPAELPEFLKNHLPNWQKIPVFKLENTSEIAAFIQKKSTSAPIQGLILAGGRSIRMGTDKGSLNWHGKPQREHLYTLFQSIDIQTFISCREDQKNEILSFPTLADSFLNLGPMGAILSAFRENPSSAWLVIACDLPFFDKNCLDFLIKNRNPSAVATAYKSPDSLEGFPEPLVAIWEPKAYQHLLRFLGQGISCPRKVLINADTHLIEAIDPNWLQNINTPEEANLIKKTFTIK